jgi:hypothetical protein
VEIETVTSAIPGTSVDVPVRVEQLNSDIGPLWFVVQFDETALTFNGLQNEVNGRDFDYSESGKEGERTITFFPSSPLQIEGSSGLLFEMVFSFTGGARDLVFSEESFLEDENGNRLSASFEDGGITESDALPVELVALDAVQDGAGRMRLSWRTASEQNNAGFSVQRRQAEEQWMELGFVDSAAPGGTTTHVQTYEYAVGNLHPGRHEFRLVQEDLDGTLHPTRSVSVNLRPRSGRFLSAPTPHPVSSSSTVSFSVAASGPVTLRLFNLLGQKVATLYRGTPSPEERVSVDFSGARFAPGTYVLRLRSRKGRETRRVTVVR